MAKSRTAAHLRSHLSVFEPERYPIQKGYIARLLLVDGRSVPDVVKEVKAIVQANEPHKELLEGSLTSNLYVFKKNVVRCKYHLTAEWPSLIRLFLEPFRITFRSLSVAPASSTTHSEPTSAPPSEILIEPDTPQPSTSTQSSAPVILPSFSVSSRLPSPKKLKRDCANCVNKQRTITNMAGKVKRLKAMVRAFKLEKKSLLANGVVFRNSYRMEDLKEPADIKVEWIDENENDIENGSITETVNMGHEHNFETNCCCDSTKDHHIVHAKIVDNTDTEVFGNERVDTTILFGGNRDILPEVKIIRMTETRNKDNLQQNDVDDIRKHMNDELATSFARIGSNIKNSPIIEDITISDGTLSIDKNSVRDCQLQKVCRFLSDVQSRELNKEKSYKYTFCKVGLTKCSNMKSQTIAHKEGKPHKCDVCGVGFASLYQWKSHKTTHTGEKPYECDVCSAGFTDGNSLKTHKITHTGEKPYKCDVCDAGFTQRGNLKTHKRKHTGEKPYKCDTCGVGFAHSGKLKTHKRKHTGEKPFQCDVCGVCFADSGQLKKHQRTHTEKPYKCDVCDARFREYRSLHVHKNNHTAIYF